MMSLVNFTKSPSKLYITPLNDLNNFYQYFVSWFIPLIIMIGSTGTILSIIVLRIRRTTQPEIRCWFLTLSSNDLFGLLFGLLSIYITKLNMITSKTGVQFDIKSKNIIFCYTYSNLIFFSLLLSSWLQAGISVLRAISTAQPLKIRSKITIASARYYLLFLISTAFVTSLSIINTTLEYKEVFYNNRSIGYRCKLRTNFRDMFYFTSLIIRVIIPTILLSISSIFIWLSLKRHQHERRKSCLTEYNEYTKIRGNRSTYNNNNLSNHSTSKISKRLVNRNNHRNISFMLLCMNLAFILANLPFEIVKLLYRNFEMSSIKSNYDLRSYILSRIIDKFLNILVYLNQSTNWLFYFMLGRKFRLDLIAILKCKSKYRRSYKYVNSINQRVLCPELSSNTIVNQHIDNCNNYKKFLSKQSTIERYIDLKKL